MKRCFDKAEDIAKEALHKSGDLANEAFRGHPFLHASAPFGLKCSDCTMGNEPCPLCYAAGWKKKHPNTHQV